MAGKYMVASPWFVSCERGARVVGLALTVTSLLVAPRARAENEPIELRVVVDGDRPPACTDTSGFVAVLTSVEPRIHAADDPSTPRAEIVFHRGAAGYRGELRYDAPGVPTINRAAEGADCNQVARALALVTALQATESTRTPPSQTVPPPPPALAEGASSAEGADRGGTITPSRPTHVAAHDVLAQAGFRSGVTEDPWSPFIHLGYGLFAEGRPKFAVRAGVFYAAGDSELTNVRLFGGNLDLCPVLLGTPKLFVTSCLRGELGAKSVAPKYRGVGDTAPWAAGGLALGVHVVLVRGLTVAFDGGALLVATRTRYDARAPDFGSELRRTEIAEAKTTASVGIGIGWTFFSDLAGPNR